MFKGNRLRFLLIPVAVFASSMAVANYQASSQALCEKVKQCAFAEMGQAQDMPPEMRAMMEQTLNSMCVSMAQPFEFAAGHRDLVNSASRCMDSLSQLSCAELQEMQDMRTAECQDFENKAAQYQR